MQSGNREKGTKGVTAKTSVGEGSRLLNRLIITNGYKFGIDRLIGIIDGD